MYVSKSEGANFWLEVLRIFRNRGVRDLFNFVVLMVSASQMPSKKRIS
ncbi:hypothetical protein [Segatella copri]|nr:hypothetical protein [Segatella copri]MCW4081072.1 hypothetical protein [Segatella copri]